jgi:hypothetical protein
MSAQYNDGTYIPDSANYADIVTFYNSRPPLYQNSTVPVVSVKEGRSIYYEQPCQRKMQIYASPYRYGYNGLSGCGNGGNYFTLYNAYMAR